MTREERLKIHYTVTCICEFARKYHLGLREAFEFLFRYKGLAFLQEFYEVEHLLSFDDVMNDLLTICQKNGGVL